MGKLEKIYNISPVWMQNLMCSSKGYLIKRRRFGKGFEKELLAFEDHQYNPDTCLNKFFEAIKFVPAYAKTFAAYPEQGGANLLSKFPIITKAAVKEKYYNFVNTQCSKPAIIMHTSGTTGGGLVFPYTIEMENKQWAVWWRYRRALGIQLNTWCGWFGGTKIININSTRAPYWRWNFPGRQLMFSSHHLSKDTIVDYCKMISKHNIQWLHGYPSTLTLLAKYMKEVGVESIDCVKWITTGSENLLSFQKAIMEEAFPNALVRSHYGLSEGVANFSQDKNGEWYVDNDFAMVEFIPSDYGKDIFRVVGTNFSNLAFPLVRYDTGDLVKMDNRKIVEIMGRNADYIELPNGKRYGPINHLFKHSKNVIEAQVHQISIDQLELRIVKSKSFSKDDEELLLEDVSARIGNNVNIIVTYCESINRSESGKVRLLVSDI